MFEQFTDEARRAVVLAQEESRLMHHPYIGSEHLLLGLLHIGQGIASEVLATWRVQLEAARQVVADDVGEGSDRLSGHIPFTPRAKRTFEYSLREGLQLGHNIIGTAHLLLGLLRLGDGGAHRTFEHLGVDAGAMQATVKRAIVGDPLEPVPVPDPRMSPHDPTMSKDDRIRALWTLIGGSTYKRMVSRSSMDDPVLPGGVRGVRVGDRIELSGIGPMATDAGDVPESAFDQTMRCCDLVLDALLDLNARPRHILRVTAFVVDADDVARVNEALVETYAGFDHALTVVGVASLPDPRWKVMLEIEGQI